MHRWFRTDASKHRFPFGFCVEPFFCFWLFSGIGDTQHCVRRQLWTPASPSWTSKVRDCAMPMLSQLRLLHLFMHGLSGVWARPASYIKQPGYHIALHARCGDVLVRRGNYKFIDDHIYFIMARTVQAMLLRANVHIFSSTFDHVSKQSSYRACQFALGSSDKVENDTEKISMAPLCKDDTHKSRSVQKKVRFQLLFWTWHAVCIQVVQLQAQKG